MERESLIRSHAEAFYQNGEFFCSEAVLKAVVEGLGEQPTHQTIAMASGFSAGLGGAGCTCGALNGGVMALGYFFGRSVAKDRCVGKAMALSRELHDWFKITNKSTCCRVLTKGMVKGSQEHKLQCVQLVGEVAEKVAFMIAQNNE